MLGYWVKYELPFVKTDQYSLVEQSGYTEIL